MSDGEYKAAVKLLNAMRDVESEHPHFHTEYWEELDSKLRVTGIFRTQECFIANGILSFQDGVYGYCSETPVEERVYRSNIHGTQEEFISAKIRLGLTWNTPLACARGLHVLFVEIGKERKLLRPI